MEVLGRLFCRGDEITDSICNFHQDDLRKLFHDLQKILSIPVFTLPVEALNT